MYETYQEAIDALSELTKNGPATEAQLDDFISQVSRHSSGNTTILYSGADADVLAAIDKNIDARMIGKTLSAKILESNEFKIAKAHSMGLEDASTIDVRDPPSPLNRAFNDIGGEWDTLSRRFVAETHGQVYGLTGVAPPDRIWAKTEIFEALKRAEVPMIEGIPRATLTHVRDDLVLAGKYATPDDATFAVRAKVSMQADDNLRNSMVGVGADGKVQWIDTERLTNGALRNLPKPPELTYTLYAEHYDRKQAAALASDNPKIRERAIETQTLRNANPQVVTESIDALRTLPHSPTRQAAIDAMAHQGSTKDLYKDDPDLTKTEKPEKIAISDPIVQNLRANGADDVLIEHHSNGKSSAIKAPETPFHAAHKQTQLNPDEPEVSRTKRSIEYGPPPGSSTYDAWTAEQSAKQAAESAVINEPVVKAQELTDARLKNLSDEIHASKALSQGSHLAESALHKVGGKLGLAGAAYTGYQVVSNATKAADNAETNQQAWQKATAAVITTTANETGINDALTAVNLNPMFLIPTMIQEQTLNPITAVTQAAQKREALEEKSGEAIGNRLHEKYSEEGMLRGKIQTIHSKMERTTDALEQQNLQDQLKRTSQQLSTVITNDLNERDARRQNNATINEFQLNNPRTKIDNDELNSRIADKTAAGQSVEQAVTSSRSEVLAERKAADEYIYRQLSPQQQASIDKTLSQYNTSFTDAYNLMRWDEIRQRGTPSADFSDGPYNRLLEQIKQDSQKNNTLNSTVTDAMTQGRNDNWARQKELEQKQFDQQWGKNPAYQSFKQQAADSNAYLSKYYYAASLGMPSYNYFKVAAQSKTVPLTFDGSIVSDGQTCSMASAQTKAKERPRPAAPVEMGFGARGANVKQLQSILNTLGADIKVNGQFDKATRAAVIEFQREHRLSKDGTIGNNDAKALNNALKAHNQVLENKDAHQSLVTLAQLNQRGSSNDNSAAIQTLQDAKPKTYNLKQGAQGEPVHQIQLALKQLGHDVPTDGQFDKTTLEAVKAFQKEYGLKPDGAMNPKDTWQLAQAVDNHQRVQAQLAEQKQSVSATQSTTTPPVNQPDVNTPAAPAASPEQTKQIEQMVSTLSATNPAFAALAPEVQMTMAAQAIEAAQAVNLQPQVQVQPQAQTVTAQVQNAQEPITQTAVPVMTTMAQAELQPVVTPVQPSPAYVAPAMNSPIVATADVEQTNRQMETVSQSAQPIVLSPTIAKLHEQITQHLTKGEFGNQLAHLSEKDQQAAIALATHEATRNLARSVDYVQINKDGDVMMGFDGHKGFSAEMNLKQVQNNEANQVLAETINLQQTQQEALAQRQSQNQGVQR